MSTWTEDIRRFTQCLSVRSEKVDATDYSQTTSFHTYQLIIHSSYHSNLLTYIPAI